MSVQLGSIIGNNIYRTDDKPQYRRGNSVLLAVNVLGIVLFLCTKTYYIRRNRQRSRIWDGMSLEVSQAFLILPFYRLSLISSNNVITWRILQILGASAWISGLRISLPHGLGSLMGNNLTVSDRILKCYLPCTQSFCRSLFGKIPCSPEERTN